ncbi:DUF2790 domain-containing protein, partial [Pseudomonas aeruginosa]|uniref:DUF2790 domain-containing protein n=1 Tax=Pseudomonas aeruginosa TaxID=287 RepID=UPI0021755B03
RDRLFRNRLEIGHVDSEMSGHALAKWPVTIYRNDRSRWAEIRTQMTYEDSNGDLNILEYRAAGTGCRNQN